MERESGKLSDYDLLDKAYYEVDKNLLLEAIYRGLDLNMKDEYGEYLWEQIYWIFPGISEKSYFEDYIGCKEEIEKRDLVGFLRLAIDNGLDLNSIGDDMGHKYAPIADLIEWCRCPELLSFLVKNGVDISLQIDENTKLIDELDDKYWFCQLEFYEGRGIWLAFAIDYLKRQGATYCSPELNSDGKTEASFYPVGSTSKIDLPMPDYSYKGFHGKGCNG